MGWRLNAAEATALKGATLQGLAHAITSDGADWRLLDFKGDPSLLKAGDKVDIMPLAKEPQHDATRYGAGHDAATEWTGLYAEGDWEQKLDLAMGDIIGLLERMPAEPGIRDSGPNSRWRCLLRKCGFDPEQ